MHELQWVLSQDDSFRYQLLDRMRMDCDYYLGYGNRYPNHLWAGDENEQVAYMKAIWNSFPENQKPEWLQYQKILEYEEQMTVQVKQEECDEIRRY